MILRLWKMEKFITATVPAGKKQSLVFFPQKSKSPGHVLVLDWSKLNYF